MRWLRKQEYRPRRYNGPGQSFPNLLHLKAKKMSQRTAAAAAKSLQSCPTLCDPTDGSPPGSAIPGILQAGILEWVAIFFSNEPEN